MLVSGPAAPTNVILSGNKTDKIAAAWSNPDEHHSLSVVKYKITCRATLDNQVVTKLLHTEKNETNKVIDNLTSNTDYMVSVTSLTNDLRMFSDESVSISRPTGKIDSYTLIDLFFTYFII